MMGEDLQRLNFHGESPNVSDARRKKRLQAEAWINDAKWSLQRAQSLLVAASHRPLKPDARRELAEVDDLVAEIGYISDGRPGAPSERR